MVSNSAPDVVLSEAPDQAQSLPDGSRPLNLRRRGLRSGGQPSVSFILSVRVLLTVAFVAVWQLIASRGIVDAFYISSPSAVYERLSDWVSDGTLVRNTWVTVEEALLGWVVGSIVGAIAGFVLGSLPTVNRILEPFMSMLNAAPRLALAPLFVIWFGLGLTSKVVLIVTVTFFVLLVNMTAGTRSVESDFLVLTRTMGASRWQAIRLVVLPSTLPWAFAGLRLALAYAFSAAVVSEFIASTEGLGYLIASAGGYLDITGQLAAMGALMIIVFFMEVLLAFAERRFLKYRTTGTQVAL